MIKIFSLLISYIFCLNLSAQSYIPIPENDAVWIQGSYLYSAYNNHEHATCIGPLIFGSDTLIGGTSYHSLHGHEVCKWIDGWPVTINSGTDSNPDELRVLFRQDVNQKRVYQYTNGQEELLYDFGSLVVGQPYPATINNDSYPQLLVMAYDSVLLNDGLYHEKWVLGSDSNDSGFVSIIEGIGATSGFDQIIGLPFEQIYELFCFTQNSSTIYDDWINVHGPVYPESAGSCEANVSVSEKSPGKSTASVWPNPFVNKCTIHWPKGINQVRLIDMSGRLLLSTDLNNDIEVELNMASIKSGSYLLLVNSADHELEIFPLVK